MVAWCVSNVSGAIADEGQCYVFNVRFIGDTSDGLRARFTQHSEKHPHERCLTKSPSLVYCVFSVGSGKTTLLNALSGQAPYAEVEGSIQYNGVDLKKEQYSYVAQMDNLNPFFTVRETLTYAAQLRCREDDNVRSTWIHITPPHKPPHVLLYWHLVPIACDTNRQMLDLCMGCATHACLITLIASCGGRMIIRAVVEFG